MIQLPVPIKSFFTKMRPALPAIMVGGMLIAVAVYVFITVINRKPTVTDPPPIASPKPEIDKHVKEVETKTAEIKLKVIETRQIVRRYEDETNVINSRIVEETQNGDQDKAVDDFLSRRRR